MSEASSQELLGPPQMAQSRLWETVDSDPVLALAQETARSLTFESIDDSIAEQHIFEQFHKHRQQYGDITSNQQYVDTLYILYVKHRDNFFNGEEKAWSRRWSAYDRAKKLAETDIINPAQYMKEVGEPILEDSVHYFRSLTAEDAKDVRVKHLRHGAYQIAQDFLWAGIDPEGLKLREVTELVFELVPILGSLRWDFKPEQLTELISIEKLFGSVVRERYGDELQQAMENRDYYKAFNVLDIMLTMGYASSQQAEALLQAMLDTDFGMAHYFADQWAGRFGYSFAKRIAAQAAPDNFHAELEPGEEPF